MCAGTPVDPSDEHFSWRAPDDSHIVPFAPERSAVVQLALNYDLCVTGEGLQHCCVAGIDDVVIGCCQVSLQISHCVYQASSLVCRWALYVLTCTVGHVIVR